MSAESAANGPLQVPVVLGPTGCGKTALTGQLDPAIFEIVSCDSRQIFSELPIGTATPTPAELQHLPHHLVGTALANEDYSAGRFVRDARAAIFDIHERGKRPLVLGGTGFYFQALRTGMFGVEVPQDVRAEISALTPAERLAEFRRLDPQGLTQGSERTGQGRIHPHDDYRVSRGLEIMRSTGLTWREHWTRSAERVRRSEDSGLAFHGWILDLPAEEHQERLRERARAMVRGGILAEARRVLERYGRDCRGLRTIGYDRVLAVIDGRAAEEQLADELYVSHRQYARKQRLWFRKREPTLESGVQVTEILAKLTDK